jgi:transcriptional regulator with XRE-family HTH domain
MARQNGFAIRGFRQLSGLDVEEMALVADVSPSQYRRIEAETRNAKPEQIARIAARFNVTPAALVRAAPAEPVSAGRETVRA